MAFIFDTPIGNPIPSIGRVYKAPVLKVAASLRPKMFHCNQCTSVSELRALAGLASLDTLHLNGCTGISDEAVAALLASLPKLNIHR